MPPSIPEFRTMARENAEIEGVHGLAFVPGAAHLRLGLMGRGLRLMLLAVAVVFVMVWRWDRFVGAFSTPHVDRWLASVFLVLLLVGVVWFSRWDVARITSSSEQEQAMLIKSRAIKRVAMRLMAINLRSPPLRVRSCP